ncbi:endolysin [Streptomyces phage Dagobah]|nr:endolysin [Streptomyces phage Dagobah]
MAPPMSASTFLAILRAEGLVVHEVGSWRTHNRAGHGAWGPLHGVVIHHTVTKGTANTVSICYNGHATLPGPLCHGVIDKKGEIWLVGWGRANHAGLGDDDVLRAVINETALPSDNEANTDGNAPFIGFECENLGDGNDPWPAAQLEAIKRASAAVCRHYGWSERSVIGHLEWQPGKVDPRGFSMDWMRDQIHNQIAAGPGGGGQEDDSMDRHETADAVWNEDLIPAPATDPNVSTNPTWAASSFLRSTYNLMHVSPYRNWAYKGDGETRDAYSYLRGTAGDTQALLEAVANLAAKVDALTVKVNNLSA